MSNYYGNMISLGGPASYSNYFNGSASLSVSSNAALAWGTGDYTVEAWVFLSVATSRIMVVTSTGNFAFFTNSSRQVVVGRVGTDELTSTGLVPLDTWTHIAATRSSNTTRIFINGVSSATPTSITTNYGQNTTNIGADALGTYTTGYISNFRAIKGTALYTSDFTPPTGPLKNISGTSLLTCQSPTIVDNGPNAFTFTNTNTEVSNYSPLSAYNPNELDPALGSATNGIYKLTDAYQAVSTRDLPMYDPYYKNVVLNISGNSSNTANNHSFTDASTNNFAITRNGNATQGSFSPYSPIYGAQFGNSAYLTYPANSDYDITGGDWTIEFWVCINKINDMVYSGSTIATNFTSGVGWSVGFGNYGADMTDLGFSIYNGGWTSATNTSINSNSMPFRKWHHIAIVRNGSGAGNLTFYLNGIATGGTFNAPTYPGAGDQLVFGVYLQNLSYAGNPNFNISNFRLVKGTAVYTSNFTPPTAALTAIPNTKVLTFNTNRFMNSANTAAPATVTTSSGYPLITPHAPLERNIPYEPSRHGGSVYLDGSGDYLTVATDAAFTFGTGEFTVEGWVYVITAGNDGIFQQGTSYFPSSTSNSVAVGINSDNTWQVYAKNTNTNSTATFALNSWNHFALVRSGTTTTLYANGVAVITVSSDSTDYTGTYFGIGSIYGGGTADINAYISNLRVVKGAAVYTGTFTPPTLAPLATSGAASAPSYPSITNVDVTFSESKTSLLLKGTNAGIYDNAAMNDLETVGNAQISTSVVKYGTGSIAFDGASDYLVSNAATSDLYAFGAGDYTIEMWIYFNNVSTLAVFYDSRPTSTNGIYPTLYVSGGSVYFYINSANEGSAAVSTGQWYHLAVCRSSGTVKMFLNGTQSATWADTRTYLNGSSRPVIGSSAFGSGDHFNGYIDDLRITKGVARYTGNFQPPTSQLQTM